MGIEVKKEEEKKKSPGSLMFQSHTPPPPRSERSPGLRLACPGGLGLTPNTRGCKHFASHINRRDSLPDTLEFSCQEPVAKQK